MKLYVIFLTLLALLSAMSAAHPTQPPPAPGTAPQRPSCPFPKNFQNLLFPTPNSLLSDAEKRLNPSAVRARPMRNASAIENSSDSLNLYETSTIFKKEDF
ncbi:unnamed protein product [Nezara viridula]|uniref:Neuropeptide n=1 Tax=Nezara viridula TaxID=85310 RepID=A0A9P0MPK8_NEZVI|nr:unnamed protein product [Nezara viridula]